MRNIEAKNVRAEADRERARSRRAERPSGREHGGEDVSRELPGPRVFGERQPVRTCVGCRQTDQAAALVRAVADPAGRLVLQRGRPKAAGRGAYIHPNEKCLIAALSRGGFERSLRRKLRLPDIAAAMQRIQEQHS
jgi:hypothetical protein